MKTDNKLLIIALGSNVNQVYNMAESERMLCELFGNDIMFSRSLWTEPIGLESDKFLNRLMLTSCVNIDMGDLESSLKKIETALGSSKEAKHNGIVNMDIDILQYGQTIYHKKDWERDYIKRLMSELLNNCNV